MSVCKNKKVHTPTQTQPHTHMRTRMKARARAHTHTHTHIYIYIIEHNILFKVNAIHFKGADALLTK